MGVRHVALPAGTAGPLVAGGICRAFGLFGPADVLWAVATVFALVPAAWWVLSALRQWRLGVDVIAVLALLGALIVGEYLADALVAVI